MSTTRPAGTLRRLGSLLAAGLALTTAGCAQRSYLVLLEDADGSTGKVVVDGPRGRVQLDRAGDAVSLTTDGPRPLGSSPQQIEADFGPALSALPPPPTTFLLYFETAGARLTPDSRAKLPDVLKQVRTYPAADISIIGHTDTVGSEADNEALGLARARAVSGMLNGASIAARAITITSHGERNLLVPTPDNTDEARNRRVEVTVR
ncbi:hypothetical protein CJ010_04030 [Azoarcus sp. DD4]|uniref:OmpA family protein n=1 Tax=Azoarcus sp. DD4 TaxID=2027405 RepID=UPI0011260C0A|nr:OmpA family protein [Azoarcus sp. DD4]QDF95779.1 hypothetical protein CJ010_04030 [Azoarcus sp. DD4]